jgi:glycosyltransferase involved in cell wall biosynthesis
MRPRVSVIIPVYNRADMIGRAIDSVLAQRSDDCELWVIDDGSTDGTPAALESYGDRIHVHRQPNAGRSHARNAGLERATGEFVALLDSDDCWLQDKLATQLAWHQAHPDAVLSGHGILVAHDDGRETPRPPTGASRLLRSQLYDAVMNDFAFFPSVIMARREDALAVGGFDARYHGAEDLDFALKLTHRGPLGLLPECLTRMYQHSGQTARKQLARENVRVLRQHLEDYALDPGLGRRMVKKMARYLISSAKRCAPGPEREELLSEAAELDGWLRLKPSFWRLRRES